MRCAARRWPRSACRRARAAQVGGQGKGCGHGVGMSQYGAYGLAKHGRELPRILAPLLHGHTRSGRPGSQHDQGAARPGPELGAVHEGDARPAASASTASRSYSLRRDPASASSLRRARAGAGSRSCGRAGTAHGRRHDPDRRQGLYRGKLIGRGVGRRAAASINKVGPRALRRRAWSRTRCRPSWPAGGASRAGGRGALLRAGHQRRRAASTSTTTPAARSTAARAPRPSAPTERRADRRARGRQGRRRDRDRPTSSRPPAVETESSSSASPAPTRLLPEERQGPATTALPRTTAGRSRYSQREMESRLSGLFSGSLRKIKVLKRGRLAADRQRAKVVGSRGSSKVSGDPSFAGAARPAEHLGPLPQAARSRAQPSGYGWSGMPWSVWRIPIS